jgi:hypothetical protein
MVAIRYSLLAVGCLLFATRYVQSLVICAMDPSMNPSMATGDQIEVGPLMGDP